MKTESVLKFARQSGYATIEYLGKYKDFDLYKPLYDNPDVATGLPVYIIVKEGLIMSEETRKLLEEQFNTIQKRLDSLEKEMKALKKVAKSTESKVDNLQKAVKEGYVNNPVVDPLTTLWSDL